ncbi:Uncharacterized conserved protein [Rhizobiales bacterium GAS113]|nr:Uncharacterized conserved protein [Rhizobiales bacterium GAS113]
MTKSSPDWRGNGVADRRVHGEYTGRECAPARKSAALPQPGSTASVELTALLTAVTRDEPRLLTIDEGAALPSGPFEQRHRSLQTGLRSWVERQTRHPLGYVEQLYTFADRDRTRDGEGSRVISISYLGLTREAGSSGTERSSWQSWYRYFPYEDWRSGAPAILAKALMPRLRQWVAAAPDRVTKRERAQRVEIDFGDCDDRSWNEELVLQRYELLYEAGLVPEAGRRAVVGAGQARPAEQARDPQAAFGQPMHHDHRRILATGIARLRAKIKYRPVVFELMPESFTLLRLQRSVEALAGRRLHKQNFRRLVEQQGLVEDTGEMSTDTGGRPAKLMRFRREVLRERSAMGTKLPLSLSG